LENNWEKEIQKKKRKVAGAAGPTRLPFGPLSRAMLIFGNAIRK